MALGSKAADVQQKLNNSNTALQTAVNSLNANISAIQTNDQGANQAVLLLQTSVNELAGLQQRMQDMSAALTDANATQTSAT